MRSLSWWCKPVLPTLEDGDRPTPGVPEPASLLSEFQASETLSQKRWTVAERYKVVLWTPRSATSWHTHVHTYIRTHTCMHMCSQSNEHIYRKKKQSLNDRLFYVFECTWKNTLPCLIFLCQGVWITGYGGTQCIILGLSLMLVREC